ncbi:MAG: outer membrane beta-barrel protein [Bacteroidota bacterium]|nr:outer membrane beta-barrel protein [Bacteroidota bacterium]MDP4258580.1 outer membrane beta-barrel protein [Bacteroidota bacterium]
MLRNIPMFRKTALSVLISAGALAASAQGTDSSRKAADSSKPAPAAPVSITGSADFYYRYDFTKANNGLTSFTSSHDEFKLGMATVKLEHKTAKMDMVADLGFGPRAQEFAYNDQGIVQAIKQLYISYSPNAWVKFTGGTWATHIGYEVLDAYANRNYSMSYMFTNGPFSHTGVRADFTVGKSGIMIGVSNPTDWRTPPSSQQSNKNMIAQYSYAPSDNFHLYLNYVGGRDVNDNKIHQYDLVATIKASSQFSVGLNGTYNHSSYVADNYATGHNWYGGAAYLNLDPTSWFGLTLREEYFSDKDGIKLHPVGGATGANVIASTLSAMFKVDGFIFIPEFRIDNASETLFTKNDGTATKTDPSFLLAAIYSF